MNQKSQTKVKSAPPKLKKAVISDKVLEAVPRSMWGLLAMAADPGRHAQRFLSDVAHRCNFQRVFREARSYERARLVSQAQFGANGWLAALPVHMAKLLSQASYN